MQNFSKYFLMLAVVITIGMLPLACVPRSSTPLQSHSVTGRTSQNTTGFEHHYFHKTEQPHVAEWGYEGDIGPKNWGSLSPAYILAKQGEQQSPIDISKPTEKELPRVVFNYRPAKINLVYNGHTIEEEEGGSHIRIDDKLFELKQFHFHAPSEHTINGSHADMEMHLVHKTKDGAVAVIAVMIKRGAENMSFTSIWENLPTPQKSEVQVARTVDATDLLPGNHAYYRYRGSFTTPPCTEGVLWLVMEAPIELSLKQVDKFKSIINGNNRPVQLLNGRKIYLSK
jgi:carbonic anhydrase